MIFAATIINKLIEIGGPEQRHGADVLEPEPTLLACYKRIN
jgi:hypothetical protein